MEQTFYPTFKAEVARKGLKPIDVVMAALSCSPKTAYNKVTGITAFTLNEIAAIRNKYFPEMTIDELFLPQVSIQTEEAQ
ncbi:MAG: hypothetical protein WA125_17520 [Desulfosporosinus sp.]